MSATRRAVLRAAWTDERREAARQRSQEQWQAWVAEHPDRAAVAARLWADIEAGAIERPVCEDCARPAHPVYDWDVMAAVGWRCTWCKRPVDQPIGVGREPAAHVPDDMPEWLR